MEALEANTYTESYLYETILIEIEDLLEEVNIVEKKVYAELTEARLASLLRLLYTAKTLKHYTISPEITKTVELLEHLISLFNDAKGFNSKRIQEVSIILSRVNPPQKITTNDIIDLINTNPRLKELVNQIKHDLENYIEEDNERFRNVIYGFAYILKKAPHKSPEPTLWDSLNDLTSKKFKLSIKKVFKTSYFKKLRHLFFNILILKEKPILLVLMIALASFLLGQFINTNYFTIRPIKEPVELKKNSLQSSFMNKGFASQFYKNCEKSDELEFEEQLSEGTWFLHKYRLFLTSIETGKTIDSIEIKFNYFESNDPIFLDVELEMDLGDRTSTSIVKTNKNKECARDYKLYICGLKNHNDILLNIFTKTKTPPEFHPTFSEKIKSIDGFNISVFTIRAFMFNTQFTFTSIGVLILIYIFFYAAYKKQ